MPSRNCIQYKVQATEKEGEKHCTPAKFLWPEVSFYVVYIYLKNMKKKFSQKCRRGHHFLLIFSKSQRVWEGDTHSHTYPLARAALSFHALCAFSARSTSSLPSIFSPG